MQHILWISAGAILGANARYWIGLWAAQRLGLDFPYGTLLVNTSGSFVLGFLIGIGLSTGVARFQLSPEMRLLIGVGFLGSYTTFSSFSVETVSLFQNGQLWQAALNIGANNILSWLAAFLGIYAARLLVPSA